MALQNYGKSAIQRFVDEGTEFAHGTISGKTYQKWDDVPKGRLPQGKYRYGANYSQLPLHVLFSYHTPIAWRFCHEDEWLVPEIHYSVTTTNHQNVARVAIDNRGFYSRK